MSDFTILRFQQCSESLKENLVRYRPWILLWGAAFLLLFWNLGTGSIAGSEGRWLAVVQNMLKTGDWLHPDIAGAAYFDKPLVSYWLIALCSLPSGSVSEFTARVPSALAALLALGSVISLARRLFTPQIALASGWILITMYSFAFWGRLAEADMENAAFIIAATAWYMRCRETKSFWGYFLFWTLCSIGAQTKGLAAFAIPGMAAALDMLLAKRLLFHCNWKSALGFLCGILVYFIPFLLEAWTRKEYSAGGLVLVFRENIVRVFNPWDHKAPWWVYFKHVPRLLIPWTPFFVLAFVNSARRLVTRWRDADPSEKWLVLTIAAIFLMFTVSKSRRVYYILPIVPFCAILCGAFLASVPKTVEQLLGKILFRLVDALLAPAALILLFSPLIFRFAAPKFLPSDMTVPSWFGGVFYFLVPLAGAGILLFQTIMTLRRKKGKAMPEICGKDPVPDRVIPILYFIMLFVFAYMIPSVSGSPEFRSCKSFFLQTHDLLFEQYRIPKHNLAFFGTDLSYGVFYLNPPGPAQHFDHEKRDASSRKFTDDTFDCGGPEEFRVFLKKIREEGGAIIGRFGAFAKLPPDLREQFVFDDLTPADGTILEADSLTDRKARQDAASALAEGQNPEKSKAVKKFRKIMREKMLMKACPVPADREQPAAQP